MKRLVLLLAFTSVAAVGQNAPNLQAETSGTCSPVVQSNQGKVQFSCNTAMNEATVKKIVTLLNTILKNTSDVNGTDKRLDEILEYLKTHLPSDWHLTPAQAESLRQIARTLPPTDHFKIYSVQDTNSIVFEQEIWKIFSAEGKATLEDIYTGWSWAGGLPQGVLVIMRNEQDIGFPVAKQIRDVLDSSRTLPIVFAREESLPVGQIKIVVGIRPQSLQQ